MNPSPQVEEYLFYCRAEKGLAANTLSAYRRDLSKLAALAAKLDRAPLDLSADDLRVFVDSLYGDKLSSRSIARHITTLRNFYTYFLGH